MQHVIARSPEQQHEPVFVVPAAAFPVGTGLLVAEAECALLFKDGQVLGALGSGRHALDPNYLPFLWNARDASGNLLASVIFVSLAPLGGRFEFSESFTLLDGGQTSLRAFGNARYRIVDPARLVLFGAGDPSLALRPVVQGNLLKMSLRNALNEAFAAGWQPLQVVADPPRLAERTKQFASAGELGQVGIELLEITDFAVSLGEDRPVAARAELVYEMLWDCRHCGSTKLLGASHRHCPNCGAPQNPAERYFPAEADKVAVQNHVYYGSDVICHYCQNGNSRKSKHCATCGGPLAEGTNAQRRQDQVHAIGGYAGESAEDARRELAGVARPQPPPAAKKTSWGRILGWLAACLVLGLLALVVLALVWKKPAGLEVTANEWKREIDVERFGPVSETAWCDQVPSGASIKGRSRAVRSHEQVQKGETCKTRKVDQGDGTFREEKECQPKYEDKPVYDDECRYTVDKWDRARTVSASGASLSDAPKWPEVVLARTGQCIGCEREGKRSQSYTVRFIDPKSKDSSSCSFDEGKWQGFKPGSKWQGQVGVLGGILDCSSLKQN